MTAPHPDAVGSLGDEFVAWAEDRSGVRFRWWQRLVSARLLEVDKDGHLLWLVLVLSMARQVGKSWWLRELCLWRMHQTERFGEPQTVLHTGKDISVCKEVQRPARSWARQQPGYKVREVNGQEEILAPDGSRWMLRARNSTYGYSASLGAVDEGWKVPAASVDDGLEPTMVEREEPQLVLISTAHRHATGLMLARRADALQMLREPSDALIIEWSSPRSAQLDDRNAWRAASPHWTAKRERLLDSKLRRAKRGDGDDPDEDDPLESFRSQWLNAWPSTNKVMKGREVFLLDDAVWDAVANLAAPIPSGPLVLSVEDWFGQGAAAAAAGRQLDGSAFVFGREFESRTEAAGWLSTLAAEHPGSRLLVGASLDGDPAWAPIQCANVETRGGAQTRTALPALRQALADGVLGHDGGSALSAQLSSMRVAEGATGLLVSPRSGRSDLARCASWAVHSLLAEPVLAFFVH